MLTKQATTAGCLFSELLIAECESKPELKCTDQEVARWFRVSPATGGRIRSGAFDAEIQDFRHVLFTPGARALLTALTGGTPWTFLPIEVAAVDADGDGNIDKDDVALLGLGTAQKGLAKIAAIQKHAGGKNYTPTALNELETAANDVIDNVRATVATARECAMTGPRAAI